ncbi:hypothetical protein HHK36_023662 [Tetracentron sinense]|uniref:PGG domain-containing protein n=1 Tax=Tetracentron sinense TaxID=13715 RepID=A0A834YRK2_TETSI|nr:hypothetical protein HHK36_023662 [Tetracentron sinense]
MDPRLYDAATEGNILLLRDLAEEQGSLLMQISHPNRNTVLHVAANFDNKSFVVLIQKYCPNLIEKKNSSDETALHIAAKAGNFSVVECLISWAKDFVGSFSREADENDAYVLLREPNKDGNTTLHEALQSHNPKGKDGLSPIHMAAIKGHSDIVEWMLKRCPDFREFLNREDQNILHVAAMSGKQKVVKSILKMPNFWMLINQKDNKGNTPLHLATIYWHPKIVGTLVRDKRVDMSVMNREGLTPVDIVEKYIDTLASFRKLLTIAALRTAKAPRGQHRPTIDETRQPNKSDFTVEFYRDRINTLSLLATLITAVTFAAVFTMPGGYNDDGPSQGMATMLTKMEFHLFLTCTTIAMYCSIIAAVTLIWTQLGDTNLLVVALRISLLLVGIALTMMALAFAVAA